MMNHLRDALDTLAMIRGLGVEEILIAFSGGKDSLVTLDLCQRSGFALRPYFRYEVSGLSEHERVFEWVKRRYGCDVIRVPSPELASKIRFGAMLPRETEMKRNLRHVDVENYLRQKTGLEWIASGIRMHESLQRRGMVNSLSKKPCLTCTLPERIGIDRNGSRIWPICHWGPQHVRDYMRLRKLCEPVRTGMAKDRAMDLSLNAENLIYLRQHNPDDYRKMLQRFPLAEVLVKRWEIWNEANTDTDPQEE